MPVEVESSSKTAVNARLSAVSTRRSRNENQIESSSDFFAELLRFNQPQATLDVAPPAPISESQPTPTAETDADPSVTTETDSNTEDETPQDSEASNQTENASATVNQTTNTQNRTLDQDLIASSANLADDDGTKPRSQADPLETVNRADEDTTATKRYTPQQDVSDKSDRSTPSRDVKKGKSTESSNTSTVNQRVEASESPTSDQQTEQTPITVDDDRLLKKERNSKTEDGPTRPVRDPNRSQGFRDTEAAIATRKPLRTGQENTAAATERPDPRAAIVTPQTISKAEKTSRVVEAKAINHQNGENPVTSNQEGARVRRRNDRSQTRARGSDAQGDPADRVPANDRSNVRSTNSTFSPTIREAVISQGMRHVSDSEVPPNAVPSVAPTVSAIPPALGSPIVAATDATSSTRGAAPSTNNANRAEPQLQPSAIASASSTAPSIQTPGRASSTAPASAGSRLSQHQESKLVQRVLRGMEQLADGGGQVRLRLHPPELGSLQMSLRIEGTAIFAEMQVETTSARDALMKNLPVLKERLSEQGMQIELFDVRSDGNFDSGASGANSQGTQDNGNSGSSRQSSRYVDAINNRLSLPGMSDEAEIARRWTRTHGALDFQA